MDTIEDNIRKLQEVAKATAKRLLEREIKAGVLPPTVGPPTKRKCPAWDEPTDSKRPPPPPPPQSAPPPDTPNAAFMVVKVPDKFVGLLIGKSGVGLKQMQAEHNAKITVGKLVEEGQRRVCIEGARSSQLKVAELIGHFTAMREAQDAVADVIKKQVTSAEIMQIPERFVGLMIGKKGENIKQICHRCGVEAQFDKEPHDEIRNLTIKGTAESIPAAREQVEMTMLHCWRRDGIYNKPLEEQFANPSPEKALLLQSIAEGAALKSFRNGISRPNMPQPLPQDLTIDLALATGHFPDLNAVTSDCGAPNADNEANHYQEVLPWAVHYASDPACVSYYLGMKAAANEAASLIPAV